MTLLETELVFLGIVVVLAVFLVVMGFWKGK